jgi:hypothetical protein
MQLPSIDRTPNMRPAGADAVSSGANRVIPVAPVNPGVQISPPKEVVTPGVIDMVNPALKVFEGEPVYTSVSDPVRSGAEAAAAPKDWTIRRPTPVKVEDPPPKPLSQVLMDHLKTMWTASANAVQVEQVQNQLVQPSPAQVNEVSNSLAKQRLVYEPERVKKNENI